MTVPRLGAAALVVAVALVTAACSTPADPLASGTPAPRATSPMPSTAPPTPAATAAAEPTCETIIADETVADFTELGWTAQAEPFRIGDLELAEGIQCTWGDYSIATDHVQIFGWAPITEAEADQARAALLADGWGQEDGTEGVYVSENPETAIFVDDEGYGITYLFGDEWVEIADTKQGLLLLEWPRA